MLSFWQAQDVQLTETNQPLGILRTEWIEDRSRIADDAITNTLRPMLGGLYEADQRNQYLMRLTPANDQHTMVAVTHYGTEQKISYDIDGDIEKIAWIPRAPDTRYIDELLNQFATWLNVSPILQTAQNLHHKAPPSDGELLVTNAVTEAWLLLDHALRQPVFHIQQQDQNTGRFIVQYPVLPPGNTLLPGLILRLGEASESAEAYQIVLQPTQTGAVIQVRDLQGRILRNAHSTRLLNQIADYFQVAG